MPGQVNVSHQFRFLLSSCTWMMVIVHCPYPRYIFEKEQSLQHYIYCMKLWWMAGRCSIGDYFLQCLLLPKQLNPQWVRETPCFSFRVLAEGFTRSSLKIAQFTSPLDNGSSARTVVGLWSFSTKWKCKHNTGWKHTKKWGVEKHNETKTTRDEIPHTSLPLKES